MAEQRGAVVSQNDLTERKKRARVRTTANCVAPQPAGGSRRTNRFLGHELSAVGGHSEKCRGRAALLKRPSPDILEALEAVGDIIDDDKRAGTIIRRMWSMLRRDFEPNATCRFIFSCQ